MSFLRASSTGCILAMAGLSFSGRVDADGQARTGTLWAPVLEWSLKNPSCEGNPFDLHANATFVHVDSGENHTTGMFYDGGDTWKFRFAGTRTGLWRFTTSSADSDLDGRRGTVTIRPNPNPKITGFVTSLKNKWARQVEGGKVKAFVPQLVMVATPDRFYNRPEKIDADIKTFLVDHGFNGFHTYVGCRWFDIEQIASDGIKSSSPDPDRRTFEALEMLITKVHGAGGMVHLWAWGDEQRRWTPVRWGKNGEVDRRLQRYLAARLGTLPGWSMGYGFDNWEWVRGDDLRRWHAYLHEHIGWPHLLGCRAQKNRLTQIYEGLDYSSYEQHRPDYATYVKTIEQRPEKPSFSEDRFRIRQNGGYAFKDYDMQMTRRGLWHSALAGGVANIWGCLEGQPSELGSRPYPQPYQIKTYARFFEQRFRNDFIRDNTLTDGLCLRSPAGRHYAFYKEDTTKVAMDLSAMRGAQIAVAVDTRKPYAEIPLGRLSPKKQTCSAPQRSDWAIAVGTFDNEEE